MIFGMDIYGSKRVNSSHLENTSMFPVVTDIVKSVTWISVEFTVDNHGPQRMNLNDFYDLLWSN